MFRSTNWPSTSPKRSPSGIVSRSSGSKMLVPVPCSWKDSSYVRAYHWILSDGTTSEKTVRGEVSGARCRGAVRSQRFQVRNQVFALRVRQFALSRDALRAVRSGKQFVLRRAATVVHQQHFAVHAQQRGRVVSRIVVTLAIGAHVVNLAVGEMRTAVASREPAVSLSKTCRPRRAAADSDRPPGDTDWAAAPGS